MASEFLFDITKSPKLQAVRFDRIFNRRLLKLKATGTKWALSIALPVFVFGFLTNIISQQVLSLILALTLLSFAGYFASTILLRFGERLSRIKASESENAADLLSFEVARVVLRSEKLAEEAKPNSSHLLYVLLKEKLASFVFLKTLLDIKAFSKEVEGEMDKENRVNVIGDNTHAEDFKETILRAIEIAKTNNRQEVLMQDIFVALSSQNIVFQRMLVQENLTSQDMQHMVDWYERLNKRYKESRDTWSSTNLRKKGSFGRAWASGHTVTLDQYSMDLSEKVKAQGFPQVVGHKEEVRLIERTLSRQEMNNVLLVGEPGSGRRSIVMDFVSRSALGESSDKLNYKKVVELDLPGLLSQLATPSEIEAVLDRIFAEAARAGNVVLVIDEFHNFVGGNETQRPGTIDITGLISKYLRSPEFQIVAITSFTGLHRYIEQNPALLQLLERVEVSEISEEETLELLENLVPRLERKYKRFVAYPALKAIIELSSKYIQAVPMPKKALDLLDEAMVYLSETKNKILLKKHIEEIISHKTQIPVGEVQEQERETLLNLEDLIHKRLINQDEAVREVASSLRRARAEISSRKGPMGSFLFLGPTGVGKTETAKALTSIYFGSENRMIRLDMSEFQDVSDIPRLLGTTKEPGFFTTQVREDPFSLILLDEIEKAHPNILNLFLQVLDEGHITDGMGRKISFEHSIIIATSNAGYKVILEALRSSKPLSEVKERLLNTLFEQGTFRPEFINRFDAVVLFQSLTKEHLLSISQLMLNKLARNLQRQGIEFVITEALKAKIVELGYNPTYGARNMQRTIQDKIENVLASSLLGGKIKRGDRVSVDAETFEIAKH